jgi:hypothetical protein
MLVLNKIKKYIFLILYKKVPLGGSSIGKCRENEVS